MLIVSLMVVRIKVVFFGIIVQSSLKSMRSLMIVVHKVVLLSKTHLSVNVNIRMRHIQITQRLLHLQRV